MTPRTIVGGLLVLGLGIFLIGAARWRLAYEQPLAASLPLIHVDRRRRAWIHVWMIVALFLTPAGVAGLALLARNEVATIVATLATVVYGIGATGLIAALAFRLTVVPWAAERTVSTGGVPDGFEALNAWAGSLYVVHMVAAYVGSALLGVAILAEDNLPTWLGWLGLAWGATFLVGFVVTRFSGIFNPPFWAHTYTGVIGVVLLTS